MIKNNGKSWLSEVEKRNQTIAHSFLNCAKIVRFVLPQTQKLLIFLEKGSFFCHKLPI